MRFIQKKFYFFYFAVIALSLLGIYNQFLRPGLPLTLKPAPEGLEIAGKALHTSDIKLRGLRLISVDSVAVKHVYQVEDLVEKRKIGEPVNLVFSDSLSRQVVLVHRAGFRKIILDAILGISFLIIALLVWRGSREAEEKYFAISALCLGLILPTDWQGLQLPLLFSLPLMVAYFLCYPQAFLTFLQFSYSFPSASHQPGILVKRKKIFGVTGSLLSFLLLAFFLQKSFSPSLKTFDLFHYLYRVFRIFLLFVFFLAMSNFVRNYFRSPDPVSRRKIEWVLWGTFIGSFPFIFLWNLPQVFDLNPLIPQWLAYLFLLVTPASLTIAILKYRLFDIEIVVSRSLVYSTVLLILTAVYFLATGALSFLITRHFALETRLFSIFSALIVALVFNPVKSRVQRFVDRKFFRIRYDRFQSLQALMRALEDCPNKMAALTSLTSHLQKFIPVTKQVIAREKDGKWKIHSGSFRPDNEFKRWLNDETAGTLSALSINALFHDKVEAQLNVQLLPVPRPWIVLLPIDRETLWLLGEKEAGTRFWKEDLDTISQMATATRLHLEKLGFIELSIRESLEKEQARKLSQWKSLLVAEVAHDLRAPLSTILWKLRNLQGRIRENSDADDRPVREIQNQIQRLQGFISSLLQLSQTESGTPDIRTTSIDLRPHVEEVLGFFEEAVHLKKMSVKLEIPGGLRVVADPFLLQEILSNLIHNAIKFSPQGETVTISAKAARQRGREFISVNVIDRAGGISEEQRKQLFEPFSLSKIRKNGDKGFHLGLYIAREFTRLLQGDLQIVSQEGQGTTVRLLIPTPAVTAETTSRNPAADKTS